MVCGGGTGETLGVERETGSRRRVHLGVWKSLVLGKRSGWRCELGDCQHLVGVQSLETERR